MSKFRDFEFRGDPNVYINREIQEVPVAKKIFEIVYHTYPWLYLGKKKCPWKMTLLTFLKC